MNTSIYYNQARLGSTLAKTPERRSNSALRIQNGILIVEDDTALRGFVRSVLSSEGYQIFEADSEAQAMKIWQEHFFQIDLLLTDLCIPYQATGVGLAKKLLAEKPWLKVIYASGFSPDIVAADEVSLIVNVNFICKPYPSSKLLEVVRKAFADLSVPSSN